MKITAKMLKAKKAYPEQVEIFCYTFPKGAVVTLANCRKAVEAGFDLDWAGKHLLSPDARRFYNAALADAWRLYEAAKADAWRLYADAWRLLEAAKADAWRLYEAAEADAFYRAATVKKGRGK